MWGGIASGIGSLAGGFANKAKPAAPKGQPIPTNKQYLYGLGGGAHQGLKLQTSSRI